MLKKITLLFVISILMFLISCASESKSADDIALKLLAEYEDMPQCSQYIKNAKEFSKGYISEEDFNNIYTGSSSKLSEWNIIEQFRLIISDSPNLFEIHVIKVANISDAEIVGKLVEKRASLIENFRKTANGYFSANKAEVYIKGKFVFLLVTSDNEKATKLIDKLL